VNRSLCISLLLVVLQVACTADEPTAPVTPPPTQLEILGGNDQTAIAGTVAADSLVVRLTDADGLPVRDYRIDFTVSSGGGSTPVPFALTNADGEARNLWQVGRTAAETQTVEARAVPPGIAPSLVVVFGATAVPGPPASVARTAGDAQVGLAGEVVRDSLVVRVADMYDNPVAAVEVVWSVKAGSGTLDIELDTTHLDGTVSAAWTLGSDPFVAQVARAAVVGLDSVDFAASVCIQLGTSPDRCFYPSADAPAVADWFSPAPPLPLQTTTGSTVGIFDLTGRGDNTYSETVAAARALEPLGIPYEVFVDVSRAGDFEFVQLAGTIRPGDLTSAEIDGLADFVSSGGILLLHNVNDPQLYDLAGITADAFEPLHTNISFLPTGDPLEHYLDHPNERTMIFGDGVVAVSMREYVCSGEVLARYEDDAAAICKSQMGSGVVYTLGFRPKTLQLFRQTERTGGVDARFTNVFNPVGDLPSLLMRGLYEAFADHPVLRTFTPPGYAGVLIITHDIDAGSSVANISAYQEFEIQQGVRATYLMQTPANPTGYTASFYSPGAVEALRANASDFDVASHSYGHFRDFDHCPLGTGEESAATYTPVLVGGASTLCSVYGEVGVSRYLLERDLGRTIEHWRSGHLVRPDGLEGVLASLGFRRASNIAAGYTGTVFPFVSFRYESSEVTEYNLMEYPLSISDGGLDEPTVGSTVDAWKEVLAANAANGAPTVFLLHPSARPGRFEAFTEFISSVNDGTYWITDLKSFADFWESQGVLRARD
jgi:hypothetical protein